jgi:hypothetical protein
MGSVDLALWLLVMGVEAAIVVLLLRGRVYKRFPIFTLYLVSTLLSDLIGIFVRTRMPNLYFRLYLDEMPLDFALQFGVLVELAWSVLRPLRTSLPKWTLLAIAVLILLAGVAVWPLTRTLVMHDLAQQWHMLLRLQQTFSALRILFFVVLAGGSQLLSLDWRDRELQIATGLGFYSLVSLAVALIHAQMPRVAHYHPIDQVMIGSYLCALAYWMVSFLQKEAPRQEFSPQMQSFLLRVSGVAHANRIALENHSLPGDRHH